MIDSIMLSLHELKEARETLIAEHKTILTSLDHLITLLERREGVFGQPIRVTPEMQPMPLPAQSQSPVKPAITPNQIEGIILSLVKAEPDKLWTTAAMAGAIAVAGYSVTGKNQDAKINSVLVAVKRLSGSGDIDITQMGRGRRPTLFKWKGENQTPAEAGV